MTTPRSGPKAPGEVSTGSPGFLPGAKDRNAPKCPSSHRILQYLFDNTWLDSLTRAVVAEFTVYNANVNVFCIITLTLETSALGKHLLVNTPAEFQKINPAPLPLG